MKKPKQTVKQKKEKKKMAHLNDSIKQITSQWDKEQNEDPDLFVRNDMFRRALDNRELRPDEIDFIKARLNQDNISEDLRLDDILKCFAYATEPTEENLKMVERFFSDVPKNGSNGSISALCRIWNLSEHYVDKLLSYINYDTFLNNNSDSSVDYACDGIARYLLKTKDKKVIAAINNLYEESRKEAISIKERYKFMQLIEKIFIFAFTGNEIDYSVIGYSGIPAQVREKYMNEVRSFLRA